MEGYERVIEPRKTELFTNAFSKRTGKVDVVELGAGTWPNAKYYDMIASKVDDMSVDVYGVDPNEFMTDYAIENFGKINDELTASQSEKRTIQINLYKMHATIDYDKTRKKLANTYSTLKN